MIPIRAVWMLLAVATLWAQPYKPKLGIEIDGFGDSSRSRPFVDHARLFRPCTEINGSARVPIDSDGWPTADAQCVMFDVRAIPAWAPPIDDPAEYQPDWSGDWQVSFEGRADLAVPSGGAALSQIEYDEASNTTQARLTVRSGSALIILSFRNTRRSASGAANSGFRGLRLIRPGYADARDQIFTDEFLRSFQPFRILRYMDMTSTNSQTPSAAPSDLLEWKDRHLPSDATQQTYGRKVGVAWEYTVLLANQTGTDMWINVPVSASEDYLRQLARLILTRLNRTLNIYIEHGNEVWNPLFANSYNYNRNAAVAEVNAGGSNLNSDNLPASSTDVFARRRHLRRVITTVRIFRETQRELGIGRDEAPGDFDNWRIRGVYAWWTIFPDQYRTTLAWARAVYGDLNQHIYGMANTHYFNVARAAPADSPDRLVEVMRASSDTGADRDLQLRQVAADFGIRHLIYEGGPDVGGGSTTNVGNRILANRLPSMKDLVRHDVHSNWFARGGGEYMYFAHCGPCSRFGCWGAAEDIVRLDTPKWQALTELSGKLAEPEVTSIARAGDGVLQITGRNLANAVFEWLEASLDETTFPSMLGGLQVTINGAIVPVIAVGPESATVGIPSGVSGGDLVLEVFAVNGTWKGRLSL